LKSLSTLGGVVAICLLLPACATVTRGTRQSFNIDSVPTGANVALSSGEQCITPCKLKLKRRPGFTATFTKDGYQTQEATVDSEVHGGGVAAGAGNVILGGIIGGIVDGSNGSLNSLTPNPLVVTLLPGQAAPATATIQSTQPATAPTSEDSATDAAKAPGSN
jgi:hypothetical protein